MKPPVKGPDHPDLFDRDDSRIGIAFSAFHHANPHVYSMLRDLAIGYMTGGHRVGMKFLYEAARHERFKTTGEWWKLNNNYHSRYARLLMEREPRLRGYFNTRELTG